MQMSNEFIERATVVLDEPQRIFKAYCIGPVGNIITDDFYNHDLDKIFKYDNFVIKENEEVHFINGEKHKLFYYDKVNTDNNCLQLQGDILNENQRFFLFLNIYCKNKKSSIIRFGTDCNVKIWINGDIVFNGYEKKRENNFLLIELQPNNNLILVELIKKNKHKNVSYYMRISQYNNEITKFENKALNYYYKQKIYSKIHLVCNNFHIDNNNFSFSILPKDFINIDIHENLKVVIKTVDNKEVIHNIETKFKTLDHLDINSVNKNHNILMIEISYPNKHGQQYYQIYFIILKNIIKYLKEEFENYSKLTHLNSSERIYAEGVIKNYYKLIQKLQVAINNADPNIQQEIITQLIMIRKKIENNDLLQNNQIPIGKEVDIFYKSKLDDSIQNYCISVPSDYRPENKYPLIIFPYTNVKAYAQDFSTNLTKNLLDQVIYAAVSIRNYTFGAYIGEAAFFETLAEIKRDYRIDEDKIYLIGLAGLCNSTAACWSLIQNYPSMFAAAICLAGDLYLKNIKNLFNVNTFTLIAGKGFPAISEDYPFHISGIESAIANHETLWLKETSYTSIRPLYTLNKASIEWLLKHTREKFPRKIYFRTERLRHNEAYWVKILDVNRKAKYCEVEAEIINDSHIIIKLINVKELLLNVPKFILKEKLKLNINGNEVCLLNYFGNELYLKEEDGVYFQTEAQRTSIYSSWGMGILDIFMDSVRIVTPSTFANEEETKVICQIAQNFSRPKTNGADPNISIEYPVISDKDLLEENIQNDNLILIGCKNNNGYIEKIKHKLSWRFDNQGYAYNDIFHQENYCLLCIEPNPLNNSKKILIVYANDCNLFLRNIFLRRVTIPSYINGHHPYLNSEVLIYTGKKYLTSNTLGMKL